MRVRGSNSRRVYEQRLAGVPEADRAREHAHARGRRLSRRPFPRVAGDRGVLLQSEIHGDHRRKLDRVSVVGGGSIYTAVQNLMLACRTEGLGCVLTTLLCEHEEKVREILAIPQPWGTAAAMPMGYPIATRPRSDPAPRRQRTRLRQSLGHRARMHCRRTMSLDANDDRRRPRRLSATVGADVRAARKRDRTRAPDSARHLQTDGGRRFLPDVRAAGLRRPRSVARNRRRAYSKRSRARTHRAAGSRSSAPPAVRCSRDFRPTLRTRSSTTR